MGELAYVPIYAPIVHSYVSFYSDNIEARGAAFNA